MTTAVGGPDKFYDFRFSSPIAINADTQYSWKLVRPNQNNNSGAFMECPNTISGNGYSSTTYPTVTRDYPFRKPTTHTVIF